MPTENIAKDPIFLFVHGTFAYDESEEVEESGKVEDNERDEELANTKKPWWQRNSTFFGRLSENLATHVTCIPSGQKQVAFDPWWKRIPFFAKVIGHQDNVESVSSDMNTPEAVFHWSGGNSERARRAAGEFLLAHIRQFGDRPLHIVAHSHGGNVLWESLCLAAEEHESQKKTPLPKVETWTTVATPFFHFEVKWPRALFATIQVLVLIYLVVAYFVSWLTDFWLQAAPAITQPPWWSATTFLGLTGSCVVSAALLCRLVWAWHRLAKANRAVRHKGLREVCRRSERDQLISVAFALVIALIATAVFVSISPAVFKSWDYWFESWRPRWHFGFASLFATLWILLAAVLILDGSIRIWNTFSAFVENRRRRRRQQRAWELFQGDQRCLCLAHANRDEAIRGLTAIVPELKGEILPRSRVPGFDDFSKNYRYFSQPEFIFVERRSLGHWAKENLLLPLAILRHWIIGWFFYNRLFAGSLDKYVLSQARRRALGLDIAELDIFDVTDHPLPNQRSRLSPDARAAIDGLSEAKAPEFLNRVRADLLADYPAPVDLQRFIKREFTDDQGAVGVLVHNLYFDSKNVASDIANFVLTGKRPSQNPPLNETPQKRRSDEDARPSPATLTIDAAEILIALALSLLPAFLVWQVGRWSVYRYSVDYHIDSWAGTEKLVSDANVFLSPEGVDDAEEPLGNIVRWTDDMPEYAAPLVVRWWLANEIVCKADANSWADGLSDTEQFVFRTKMGQKYAECKMAPQAKAHFQRAVEFFNSEYFEDAPEHKKQKPFELLARSLHIADSYCDGAWSWVEIDQESRLQDARKTLKHVKLFWDDYHAMNNGSINDHASWYHAPIEGADQDALATVWRISFLISASNLVFDEDEVVGHLAEAIKAVEKQEDLASNDLLEGIRLLMSISERVSESHRPAICDSAWQLCNRLDKQDRSAGRNLVARTRRSLRERATVNEWLQSLKEYRELDERLLYFGTLTHLGQVDAAYAHTTRLGPSVQLKVALEVLLRKAETLGEISPVILREALSDLQHGIQGGLPVSAK